MDSAGNPICASGESRDGKTPAPSELQVAIVDDDESIRLAVQTLLARNGISSEAYPSAEAFLAEFRAERIGCIVLDLQLPGVDGLQLQELLNRQGVDIPVIVFTAQGSIPKAVRALKNGAVDFVEKPFDNRDLVRRIQEYVEQETSKRQRSRLQHSASGRLASLTVREREVMDRIVLGRLNKHIADELGICVKTVEFHRSKIMHKIGVHSVAELVQLSLADPASRPVQD